MPFQPTPRSMRDEVMFDLDEQLTELQAIAGMLAHIQRRVANVNRLRHQSIRALREAQTLEAHAAISPALAETSATIAGHLRGAEVAA